jgi:hypothetical protein
MNRTQTVWFSKIESPRRFVGPDRCQVLAIYDQTRSYTLYGPVGSEDGKTEIFVGPPRSYFADEVEEVL